MSYKGYTDEEFVQVVANSSSIRQALMGLGLRPAGGNYSTFASTVKRLNLDTSHFTGKGWNKGKTHPPIVSIEDYLRNEKPVTSHRLRLRLLREGVKKHQCESCLLTEWFGDPIPLELDHINGQRHDNRLENLQLLCPNCHALTPTYRGKNKGSYKA